MIIREIVNRDIVNLSNCEQEPIHIPGSIQPHGFLLGFEQESRKMEFCSGNVKDFLGLEPSDILGRRFEDVFGADKRMILRSRYDMNEMGAFTSTPIELAGRAFQAVMHRSPDGRVIVEFEPDQTDTQLLASVYTQTAEFVSYLNNTQTLRELCDQVAIGTRKITGYDRVMVYRFDKEYNGEVYAESCREDLEPFLGLHYPHTDIPSQARSLYMKNLLRLIVDIEYTPVPIYTLDDEHGKNLDLSLSSLRSTSPIHAEYLKNMGVGATLTISLIHRGKLWGLIACHHYAPKNLTPQIRLATLLQGQFITSQIDVRQSNEEYDISRKTSAALSRLNAHDLPPVVGSFQILASSPELLQICDAAGVTVLVDGIIFKNGVVPEDSDVRQLSAWLDNYTLNTSFSTEKLVRDLPHLPIPCSVASGILYHSLSNGNSIIWYRPESLSEVHWAGDPEKAIIKDEKGLHPRNSFSQWKQIVKCKSKDWLQPELAASANFADTLTRQINLLMLSREEARYRELSKSLQEANDELENINWISTHDLQEPLRKIQLITSRLLMMRDKGKVDVFEEIKRLNVAANKMQLLLNDILKYIRISANDPAYSEVSLDQVVSEVLNNLEEQIQLKQATVTVKSLPNVSGIEFLIRQLFTNIILNALKYASKSRRPEIAIEGSLQNENGTEYHVIRITDNGIGFEPQYAETIFKIFRKLHSNTQYAGSGIGLALCRKIMKMHNGRISAKGLPDKGAEFTLQFPLKN